MVEIKIDASELKGEGKDVVKSLSEFVKEKTNAEVTNESKVITVKGEGAAVTKKYLRVLIKKFLHHNDLKDTFRVIAGEEATLKVKELKVYEE
jgi:hypothetical protein